MLIISGIIRKIKLQFIKKKLHYIGTNPFISISTIFKDPKYITIGDNFFCSKHCNIEVQKSYFGKEYNYDPSLIIGNNVSISPNCFISCLNKVIISDGCLIGNNVYISDNFHGKNSYSELGIPPRHRNLHSKGPVYIGKNVWLGRNVCVMPNVSVGDYSVIGANSVVTHDIPPYSVAVGCPAKVIKIINK